MFPYTANVTETLTFPLVAVAADWSHFDCQRLATEAEMAEAKGCCSECGVRMVAKVGGAPVAGTVIGYRFGPDTMWVWTGVLCRDCEIAAAIADGYK